METTTVEIPAVAVNATAAAAWVIVALLAAVAWFVRREIKQNDKAHSDLAADIWNLNVDVKTLLASVSRIEGVLIGSGAYPPRSSGGEAVHEPGAGYGEPGFRLANTRRVIKRAAQAALGCTAMLPQLVEETQSVR